MVIIAELIAHCEVIVDLKLNRCAHDIKLSVDVLLQADIEAQKDELQRQRNALQCQINMFEEQRRQHAAMTSRPGSGDRRPSPNPADASAVQRSESPLTRTTIGGTASLVNQLPLAFGAPDLLAPLPSSDPSAVSDTTVPAQAVVGSLMSLEGRHLPRAGSAGSLIGDGSRRGTRPQPTHLLSATKKLGGGGGAEVHQLIPTRLSSAASSSTRSRHDPPGLPPTRPTDRRDHDLAKKSSTTADTAAAGRPTAGGRSLSVAAPPAVIVPTPANVLPMHLAETRAAGVIGGPRTSNGPSGLSSTAAAIIEASTPGRALSAAAAGFDGRAAAGTPSTRASTTTKKPPQVTEIIYI